MTKQKMYLRMITSSLLRRKSRMLIALLAVAIGATILFGLATIFVDIPQQMGQEFRSYGANIIFLPSSDEDSIDEETMQEIRDLVPDKAMVGMAPYIYENVRINELPFLAAGTDLEAVQKTSPYWYVSGEWPSEDSQVLVGKDLAETVGAKEGEEISIKIEGADEKMTEHKFTVAGILQTGGNEENYVFMSTEALTEAKGKSDGIDVIECSISQSQDELKKLADKVSEEMPGVTPRLVKRVTESEGTVLTKLQALVLLVTIVVLGLTMVCVATTMMAVVVERRKEIGLKKALGASNRSITRDFLGEGFFLGLFGGGLGIGLGYLFAQAVSMSVFSRPVFFHPVLIPITLGVAVGVTVLACLIPVRRATDVDPALVLKGE